MCNNGFVNKRDNRKMVMAVSRNVMTPAIMNCLVSPLTISSIDSVPRNIYTYPSVFPATTMGLTVHI